MSEEKKEKLKDYQKNYFEAKKSKYNNSNSNNNNENEIVF